MPRIWIDVEDLFIYGASGLRPSGIQRLELNYAAPSSRFPRAKTACSSSDTMNINDA